MTNDSGVAAVGSRREGRERVLGLLYEAESKDVDLDDVVASLPLPLTGYAAELLVGLGEHLQEIDEIIESASHRWKVARMPAVDRALLRLGTFELSRRPDVPAGVVIIEAVELAAEYSTDSSSRFVNGILAALATQLRPDEPNSHGSDVPGE